MYRLVGRFKILVLVLILVVGVPPVYAFDKNSQWDAQNWPEFATEAKRQISLDEQNGISYMIGGSLALIGGLVGSSQTSDNVELAVFTVFQALGVASVGYGYHLSDSASEQRFLYNALNKTKMTTEQKSQFLTSYWQQKNEARRRTRWIRAITHTLVGGVILLNAQNQGDSGLKTALYIAGGVNLLSAISFTFEF